MFLTLGIINTRIATMNLAFPLVRGHVFCKYSIPVCMIMGRDSAFMSTLIDYLFKRSDITIKTVVPYNHQSLQMEHGINT